MHAHTRRAAVALVLLVAVAACSTGGDDQRAAPAGTAAPAPPPPPPPAPLTGVPEPDDAVRSRPALVVKVDNSPQGRRLHHGVELADVVFDEKVEGGATRLAAVFQSRDVGAVGPVRSARTTDVSIVSMLNRPLFAFSGANGGVLRIVRRAPLVDVGFDVVTGDYEQRRGVPSVLRLFVSTDQLYRHAPGDAAAPAPLFEYRDPGDGGPALGAEPVTGVRISYGGQVSSEVTYEAGDGAASWPRSQDGAPHVTAGGERIAPTNVVVQFTQYRSSGFFDTTGAASPEAVLVGEGDVWVLTGGALLRGRWQRPDEASVTRYVDDAGRPILLAPGTTWVELAPPGSAAVIESPAP